MVPSVGSISSLEMSYKPRTTQREKNLTLGLILGIPAAAILGSLLTYLFMNLGG